MRQRLPLKDRLIWAWVAPKGNVSDRRVTGGNKFEKPLDKSKSLCYNKYRN